MTIEEAAGKYLNLGYSIIPVGKDKKPLISWEKFQKERADLAQVTEWLKKYPSMNLAIITGAISGLTVIDCDSQDAIEAFKGMADEGFKTPTQSTPRGGRHYVCTYAESVRNKAAVIEHMDVRSEGGYIVAAPSRNGNDRAYEWVEGCEPWTVPPSPLPLKCLDLLKSPSNVLHVFKDARSKDNAIFNEGHRDDALFHIANCAVRGGLEPEYVREVLIRLVNSWGEHDPKWVEDKIKSALQRTERKERNLAQEIREWVNVTSGDFSVTLCDKECQVVTSEERTNRRKIIQRLVESKIIEKDRSREGIYRRIDSDLEEIDFINVKDEEIKLSLPFEIEKFVKIMPKNIIVVAGEPNAGKTAFLLNVAKDNQHDKEIHYFSSEMGAYETRERLGKFDYPLDQWRAKFWERSSDFADVIRPNAVNIIDFLEIHENFWEVGKLLKQIHDRLDKGVCFVALQKNPRRKSKDGTISGEVGLGGMRGLEKPRLYLTMSTSNIIQIIKAKNWRTMTNPNGLGLKYKIVQGCKLIRAGSRQWTNAFELSQKEELKGVIDDSDFPTEREH